MKLLRLGLLTTLGLHSLSTLVRAQEIEIKIPPDDRIFTQGEAYDSISGTGLRKNCVSFSLQEKNQVFYLPPEVGKGEFVVTENERDTLSKLGFDLTASVRLGLTKGSASGSFSSSFRNYSKSLNVVAFNKITSPMPEYEYALKDEYRTLYESEDEQKKKEFFTRCGTHYLQPTRRENSFYATISADYRDEEERQDLSAFIQGSYGPGSASINATRSKLSREILSSIKVTQYTKGVWESELPSGLQAGKEVQWRAFIDHAFKLGPRVTEAYEKCVKNTLAADPAANKQEVWANCEKRVFLFSEYVAVPYSRIVGKTQNTQASSRWSPKWADYILSTIDFINDQKLILASLAPSATELQRARGFNSFAFRSADLEFVQKRINNAEEHLEDLKKRLDNCDETPNHNVISSECRKLKSPEAAGYGAKYAPPRSAELGTVKLELGNVKRLGDPNSGLKTGFIVKLQREDVLLARFFGKFSKVEGGPGISGVPDTPQAHQVWQFDVGGGNGPALEGPDKDKNVLVAFVNCNRNIGYTLRPFFNLAERKFTIDELEQPMIAWVIVPQFNHFYEGRSEDHPFMQVGTTKIDMVYNCRD